jgi:uncharacterized membrane protein
VGYVPLVPKSAATIARESEATITRRRRSRLRFRRRDAHAACLWLIRYRENALYGLHEPLLVPLSQLVSRGAPYPPPSKR